MKSFLLLSLLIVSTQALAKKTTCYQQDDSYGGYELSYESSGLKKGELAFLKLGTDDHDLKPIAYEVQTISPSDALFPVAQVVLKRVVSAKSKKYPSIIIMLQYDDKPNQWDVEMNNKKFANRPLILECKN